MIFSSTIIPTIGRPLLERAVTSVLEQGCPIGSFEIIVVNDSGQPLPPMPCLAAPPLRVIETQRTERSVARNTGAAVARGAYLHFLDDDDYLLPGGLQSLHGALPANNSARIYGGVRVVDRLGEQVDEVMPTVAGDLLALYTAGESIHLCGSIIRRDTFFAVGGFDPALTVGEDHDLEIRLALHGETFGIKQIVGCVAIGEQGSSTAWSRLRTSHQYIREKTLDMPTVFRRLREAVRRDTHLCGRICRIYLASALLNLRRGYATRAAGRLFCAARLASRQSLHPTFWSGLANRPWFQRPAQHGVTSRLPAA